jgi:hypothetical protein
VKNFAQMAMPLTNLLFKKVVPKKFNGVHNVKKVLKP